MERVIENEKLENNKINFYSNQKEPRINKKRETTQVKTQPTILSISQNQYRGHSGIFKIFWTIYQQHSISLKWKKSLMATVPII